MENLQKYELINKAETFERLYEALEQIGTIEGTRTDFTAEYIITACKKIQSVDIDFTKFYGATDKRGYGEFNMITRTFGLRAKVIYLKLYAEDRDININ